MSDKDEIIYQPFDAKEKAWLSSHTKFNLGTGRLLWRSRQHETT